MSVHAQRMGNRIDLSDKVTTEVKNVQGFDKIDVSEDFEVRIRYSDSMEGVEIEANENLHDLIIVECQKGTLKIHTKPYSTSNGSYRRGAQEHLVAYITVKNLTEIRGSEDVTIVLEDRIHAEDLLIDLNEDSVLEGYIKADNLVVLLDEDSVLDIEGSAKRMQIEANEDSTIDGLDFIVGRLKVSLNEDSQVKLTVNGEIDLRAREDSSFYYEGKGTFVRKRLTGDSEVKHW